MLHERLNVVPHHCWRDAAVALGHTVGFLTFRAATAEGQAVWAAMNGVHLSTGGATFSYGSFYTGFGLSITVTQFFSAWLAWYLGQMSRRGASDARVIAWVMCLIQVAGVGLSLLYFSAGPALLSVVAAVCWGMGAWSMRSRARV